MGGEQRVVPESLERQAQSMDDGQPWHNPAAEAVQPPDALPSSSAAVANLNANAKSLLEFQNWAEAENKRIAEMLTIAAAGYRKVDEQYGESLDNPERQGAVEAITLPAPSTPPAPTPTPVGAPQALDAGGYSDVYKTQADLTSPDDGASLKAAMLQWALASKRAADKAPKPPPGDWEGEAADAAFARMTEFAGHLRQLSLAWEDLGEAAAKILEAHNSAKSRHTEIHTEYQELDELLKKAAAEITADNAAAMQVAMEMIRKRMEVLQRESDEVREQYASAATFSPVRPEMPAARGADSPTTAGGGGGGAGDKPTGDPAAMAEKMAQSLGGPPTGMGGKPGGGAPAGGGAPSGGGGAPSGGAGSGGGAPGGLPGGGAPKLPTDPSLRPAAASGAGSGGAGGGAGGGGGGGMPATPMSAPVTAETVAPAPTVPAAASAAPAPGGAGGAMGGMGGGMAPMGHGAGAQQGKEKKRDSRLAPDEDLYTEDRPWTEAVIGNRRRREAGKGGAEGTDSK